MRTDMALEMRARVGKLDGVDEQNEWAGGIGISRISVRTAQAAEKLDKPVGRYITLTMPEGVLSDRDASARVSKCLASELSKLFPAAHDAKALVVGLGNRYVTPDALGPRVSEHVYVTRHIKRLMPEILPQSAREVSACAPNVLGVTGMETLEVVSGLVKEIQPAFVLAVDCLCSADSRSIGVSVQMNDSGISPGAGVGNFQKQLNEETLGVPVIAIGMPLVISRETIVDEALAALSLTRPAGSDELLDNDLIVTPKDIDSLVRDASRMLSDGVNTALFGALCAELGKLLP